jgi:hypothetical protein
MVWLCAPKPVEEGVVSLDGDELIMVKVKGNIVDRKLKGLAYKTTARAIEIEGKDAWIPFVDWRGEVDQRANDLASSTQKIATHHRTTGRPAVLGPAAEKWLKDILSTGPVELSGLEQAGKSMMGFSQAVLLKARRDLGVLTFVSGKHKAKDGKMRDVYSCRLPEPDADAPAPVDLNAK